MAGITLCHAGQARAAVATKTTQRQADQIPQATPSVFAAVCFRRYKLEILTMNRGAIELINGTIFLLVMGVVIYGLMGAEAWLWQLIKWAIDTFA